jgi:hypothetical protein
MVIKGVGKSSMYLRHTRLKNDRKKFCEYDRFCKNVTKKEIFKKNVNQKSFISIRDSSNWNIYFLNSNDLRRKHNKNKTRTYFFSSTNTGKSRELLPKRKVQYNWPPYTN